MNRVKSLPSLMTVMTPFPYSIEHSAPLSAAREMMEEHQIRHLPVIRQRALFGLLSARDIALAGDLNRDAPAEGDRVEHKRFVGDVCARPPFVVDHQERLDYVLSEMVARHVGSALITRNDKLVGILTAMDACEALADLLRRLSPPTDSDDVA